MSHLSNRVHYREGTVADVPAMVRSRGEELTDQRMAAYLAGQHHPRQALAPRVAFVAIAASEVVGYIAGHLTRRLECDGEVQYLFVTPEQRRLGVASALLRLLTVWFVERGALKVCVDANPDSAAARPFYLSRGATELGPHWLAWADIRALAAGKRPADDA